MNKEAMRRFLKEKRKAIGEERRREASRLATDHLYATLAPYRLVLSIAPMPSELDLWPLNDLLMQDDRLLLPRTAKEGLIAHRIASKNDLVLSAWGVLEPKETCPTMSPSEIACVLVPGLGFDKNHQRIGYGQGHFDALLATLPKAQKIGVGFREQLIEGLLPIEPHDIALNYTALF